MTEKPKQIIFARHLKDYDKLRSFRKDSPIYANQEKEAREMATRIAERCKNTNKTDITLYSSTKRRGIETCSLMKNELSTLGFENTSIIPDSALRELDQGEIEFPDNFKDGDYFEPLQEAWKIYWQESFENKNLLYKFGDPIGTRDGGVKYPLLDKYFKSHGECYADFAIRLYDFICKLPSKLNNNSEIVVVTHSSPVSVLREIVFSLDKLDTSFVKNIPLGSLPQLTWDTFNERFSNLEKINFGHVETFDLTNVFKPELLEIIAIERDYLIALKTQQKV